MNRRQLLKFMGSAAAASTIASERNIATASPATGRRKLNLLFLFTDQQRQDTLAAYGNHQIKVPNLNRLASESVIFNSCYCTQPLCTPSRGSLLTGLWPHTHGEYTNNVPLAPDIPVLVQMLPTHKYRTAYFGKWHLGNEIFRQRGFDEFESTEDGYEKYNSPNGTASNVDDTNRRHSGYYRFLVQHGQTPDANGDFTRSFSNSLPEELSKPAYLAKMANGFLQQEHDKPWVMYVNFLDPHTPYGSAFHAMYDPDQMTVPESFDIRPDTREVEHTKAIRAKLSKEHGDADDSMPHSAESLRRLKALYWGKISLVDTMIGRILKTLEETHQADNTMIVFTTDHGDMMGDHHLMYKSVMYEEATKIPFLIKLPDRTSSSLIQQPVSNIDVVPTLLDLLGEQVPPHLQGQSLAPYIKTGTELPERSVIIEWNGRLLLTGSHTSVDRLRTLRTFDGWKMTLSDAGEGELYYLPRDPKEVHNLFYEPDSLKVIQKLAAEICLWQKSTGDPVMQFDEKRWKERQRS